MRAALKSESGLEGFVGFVNGFGALVEEGFLLVVEVELNDFLDTVAADDGGNTDAEVAFTVFTVEQAGAGDEFLLVVEHCGNHLGRSCTGSIPCRCAEEFGECGAAYHGVGCHFGKLVGGDEARCGQAAVSCEAGKGNHGGVAVAADHDAFNFGCVGVQGQAEEVFEACAVQCAAHADDAVFGQTGDFVNQVGHRCPWGWPRR